MTLFKTVAKERHPELNQQINGSLFHTIEYELSDIVRKIENIDQNNDEEIKDIILRQHRMILNYDLFLKDHETREEAQRLFTNKRFLQIFLNEIQLLDLTPHEITCINKLCYDYYITPENDEEVFELLYRISMVINNKVILPLSTILGMNAARILAMVANSSFVDEKNIHRVNTFLIKSNFEYNVQSLIDIFCILYKDSFTNPFIYTMMEAKPKNLSNIQYKTFDQISMAIIQILDSLPSADMKKILSDYAFILTMVKQDTVVRFSLKSLNGYPRILKVISEVENDQFTRLVVP